jgi:hypothetical protein
VNEVTMIDERPQPPERDHQAGTGTGGGRAFEDVPEARYHEAQRGWCQRGSSRTSQDCRGTRTRAVAPSGRMKRKAVETFWASRSTRGSDRELGAVGLDRDIRAARRAAAGPVEIEAVASGGPARARVPARTT